MSLLSTAVAALTGAERRVEIAARNVANANTPGYKREIAFAEAVERPDRAQDARLPPEVRSARNLAQAALIETGATLDLAVDGDAVLLVRSGEWLYPSRGGGFTLAADGSVADAEGRRLQQAGGGDLVLEAGELVVHPDGAVFVDEVPAGAVGLYSPGEGAQALVEDGLAPGALAELDEADGARLRQGMLERSNVTLSDEMVGLMQTQRMSEAAAQLVRTYDELVGQAATTFSRSGR